MTTIVTLLLTVLTFVAWIGADVWLYYRRQPDGTIGGYYATISYLVLTSSRARPIIAFGAGIVVGTLAGHFWFPQ